MMLKALIVEQIEADGSIRTFRMRPSQNDRDIVVAFADEYMGKRVGPFHFLDDYDAHNFEEGFANCRIRRLSDKLFSRQHDTYHIETYWSGIPTERQWLSYYALSLPEFAIPTKITVSDPHQPDRQYRRNVIRDDERNRYVIYLECTSRLGRFDFRLMCDYVLDRLAFPQSQYADEKTSNYGSTGNDWQHWLSDEQQEKVQQFFISEVHVGDNYTAGQAGAMGPRTSSSNMTFNQKTEQGDSSNEPPE